MRSTPQEISAFEAAQDCLAYWFDIHHSMIADECNAPSPDIELLASLRTERSKLARLSATLTISDSTGVARVLGEYGAMISVWREQHHSFAA
ncbi:hypothetical protein [Rhodoferax sp.]|uniref:hypothetical protein n=1 Tax=Rhodoferax sp. TaxID=50421 RepID=UPI0027632F92|nr:hypothetical protein [Rhodoferax sp.]